jgi:8-oxo-dGTP pyrophosphatase MutT (NUDIX family)
MSVTSESPSTETAPARPAATVMLLRDVPVADGAPAIEVFMLRRTGSAAFGAGMYVFPGGRVDPADGTTEIARYCRGLDDATASARLGVRRGGIAYWIAAVRECFEEAGVLLADRRDGEPVRPRDDDRHAVHDGELGLVELCRRDDLVLDLSTTHYVAHWVTPVGEGRRFDTRFFVSAAPPGQEPLHDEKETVDSLWVRPDEALLQHAAGDLMMMPPTAANLAFLAPHGTVDEALAAAAAVEQPPRIQPKLRRDGDGTVVGIAMPDDDDYADLPE